MEKINELLLNLLEEIEREKGIYTITIRDGRADIHLKTEKFFTEVNFEYNTVCETTGAIHFENKSQPIKYSTVILKNNDGGEIK